MEFNALKPKEVGKKLGVSSYTILELIRGGKLKAFKIRKQWRVLPEDLDEFITQGKLQKGDGDGEKS